MSNKRYQQTLDCSLLLVLLLLDAAVDRDTINADFFLGHCGKENVAVVWLLEAVIAVST